MKELTKSKRFWSGIIALVTGISLLFTGEQAANEVVSELVMTVIGLVQTIIGITSTHSISVSGKAIVKE